MSTHPVRTGYLVEGIIFLGAALIWALNAADLVDLVELRWLVPVLLILAGSAGLASSVAAGVRRSRQGVTEARPTYAEPPADTAPITHQEES